MILKASHHPVIYPFFKLYTVWKIHRHFNEVKIRGGVSDKGLPLLLISNHFSWWDGFWAMYLNMKLFRRKFCFMMQEENLRKYSFFNKTGGYSVRKGSKSIFESLEYTVKLLKEKRNLVLIFPQGEIEPMRCSQVTFQKGLQHILQKINEPVQIVFLVNIIEYYSNPRPTLFMNIREFEMTEGKEPEIEKTYRDFYYEVLSDFSKNDLL